MAAEARATTALAEADREGLDPEDLAGELERLSGHGATLTALLPAERRLTELRAQESAHAESLGAVHREQELAAAEHAHLRAQVDLMSRDLAVSAEAVQRLPRLEAEATALRAAGTAAADPGPAPRRTRPGDRRPRGRRLSAARPA